MSLHTCVSGELLMYSVSERLHLIVRRMVMAAAVVLLVAPLLVQASTDVPLDAVRAGQIASAFGGAQGLQTMDDETLGGIEAQAGSLILMDRVAPNELTGALGAGSSTDFSYYRMGMDVKLDLNANMSKLQLGCGGVNDYLTGARGCDLDIDYVGFMGLNPAGDRPGLPGSPFTLTRPFIEIAFKNENTAAKREVVGFRIGAQSINGAIRMGRDYTGLQPDGSFSPEASMTNMENGGTCNPGASTGTGVVNCHSGLNSISGFLAGLELSAGFEASVRACTLGRAFGACLGGITANLDGCLGRISFSPCNMSDTPFFVDAGGTRLTSLNVAAAKLKINFVFDIEGYGRLNLDTRQVHYLLTPNSSDFFLSFQRERVSWPRYNKTTPQADLGLLNGCSYASCGTNPAWYDSCNSAHGQVTGRCTSAYSPPANSGWWLSAANAKVLNLRPGDRINVPGNYTLLELLGALGPSTSPLVIDNPKLGFVAADNCYGSARFC